MRKDPAVREHDPHAILVDPVLPCGDGLHRIDVSRHLRQIASGKHSPDGGALCGGRCLRGAHLLLLLARRRRSDRRHRSRPKPEQNERGRPGGSGEAPRRPSDGAPDRAAGYRSRRSGGKGQHRAKQHVLKRVWEGFEHGYRILIENPGADTLPSAA